MEIKANLGDVGTVFPLTLSMRDGTQFSIVDLQSASYNLLVTRIDSLRLQIESGDTVIYPNAGYGSDFHKYKVGHSIKVGDEVMSITAVDQVNKALTVTRTLSDLFHRRGTRVIHTVSASATAVTFNNSRASLELTLEAGVVDYKGYYLAEVEVDTGAIQVSCTQDAYQQPIRLTFFPDSNT